MLEALIAAVKSLPTWLGTVTEIMIVALIFTTAITLLAGIWIGILVVKRRARSIKSFTLIPFRIDFEVDPSRRKQDATQEGNQ